MKKIIVLIFVLPSIWLAAQSSQYLDTNNIKALFWANGDMFSDEFGNPEFEYPKGSGLHSNHLSGLWIFGIESLTSGIHGAATGSFGSGRDFYPGPLDTIGTASVDTETVNLYNRVWKISIDEIRKFKLCNCDNPDDPSCAGYSIPSSIANWPGNPIIEASGDHTIMENDLAPFYDANNDGVYNPADCDYPLIKGHQAVFFVFNDMFQPHGLSGAAPMGLEIRALAYAFDCPAMPEEDAIYIDYEIINRSTKTYKLTSIGMISDGTIGGVDDGYVGTNVDDGYTYIYNKDAFDADNIFDGYGANPPATGIKLLQGPLADPNGVAEFWDESWSSASVPTEVTSAFGIYTPLTADTIRNTLLYGINALGYNDGIIDNERLGMNGSIAFKNTFAADGIPSSLVQFYNYSRTFYADGMPQRYGGDGYGGTIRCDFAYPFSDDEWNFATRGVTTTFDWSEFNTGVVPNDGMDKHFLQSSKNFTFKPGDRQHITYVFASTRTGVGSDSLNLQALNNAMNNITFVSSFDSSLTYNCAVLSLSEIIDMSEHILLYPNPASSFVTIQTDENEIVEIIEILGIDGKLLTTYTPHSSSYTFDISNFSPGLYILRMKSGNKFGSKRFIKVTDK